MMKWLGLIAPLFLFLSSCAPSGAPTPTVSPTVVPTSTVAPTVAPTAAPMPSVVSVTPTPTVQKDPVTLHILFIGSSHIYYPRAAVNLPRIFARLAESGGHQVVVDKSAKTGIRLADHVADPKTLEKIDSAQWDFVILQEDMYIAADKDKREEQMYPAARFLDQRIKSNGAQTIFFQSWVNPWPIRTGKFEDYLAEQARLTAGYQEIAQELDALVAPAGIAVENALQQRPDLYLWYRGDDAGHASGLGQYLAACVFYALIYQESPEGLSYTLDPAEVSRFLQSVAAETVLGDSTP